MARPVKGVPELKQRNGVYNIFYYDEQAKRTKRIGLRTRDPVEATTRFAAFLTEGRDVFAPTGEKGISVHQALDDYYKEHVTSKDDKGRPNVVDVRRIEDIISNLKSFFKGPLSEIDVNLCRQYTLGRRSGTVCGFNHPKFEHRKAKDSTIRRELGALRTAAKHALKWKRITLDKFPTFERPKEPEVEDEYVKWFLKTDIDRILGAAEGRMKVLVHLLYYWGARWGWVAKLQRFQVDFDNEKVNPYKPGEKRTNKRRRSMPIFPEIRSMLTDLCEGLEPNDYLFGKNFKVNKPFGRLCASLKLDGNPHMLRHSRATHLLLAKESIYVVARLLADTPQTVERIYGHIATDQLREIGRQKVA